MVEVYDGPLSPGIRREDINKTFTIPAAATSTGSTLVHPAAGRETLDDVSIQFNQQVRRPKETLLLPFHLPEVVSTEIIMIPKLVDWMSHQTLARRSSVSTMAVKCSSGEQTLIHPQFITASPF